VPENTLAAFTAAVAVGADGIETDVRVSADGVPILFHDAHTADGQAISSLSQAQLSDRAGYAVPTLEAALALPQPANFLWNVEIKTPDALAATVALLERVRTSRRFLVTSFWHPVVAEVSRQLDVDCGVLVAHRPLEFQSRPDWVPSRPNVNAVVWYYENLDAPQLAQATACGLRNFVYGAVTPEEHQRLVGWNVDAVITDFPAYLRKKVSSPRTRRCARRRPARPAPTSPPSPRLAG
jgi:glycerophosphoryl diester phosphodiesterase